MRCPRCQHENPPGSNFCLSCGAGFGISCSSCGNELPAGSRFCNECGTPVALESTGQSRFSSPESYTPKHLAEKILTSKAALEGERKQVTVLFADLKGSMELLADRDPEDARNLLDPVLELMMQAVHRYEGTVNQVMGDGIMALFGAPIAHEDHAVRACYAALQMQESIKRCADGIFRSHGVPVEIRIGLNSGEVVVRAIGSDLHMDYTAVGQTTHLAARMEQMARPGTILLAPDTLALAEAFVQVTARGAVPVKGLASPVEIFELAGASPVRSRLHAAAARGLTRFVGRDAEIEILRQALARAEEGSGQVVAIVGEPGVGKSRLVWEFTHSHRRQGWLVLETASVSYGKASTYFPVIQLLRSYFSIEPRDDVRTMREKVIDKLQSLDHALEPTVPVFLSLLDVPVEDAEWTNLDPAQRRRQTLDALRRLVLRETQEHPVLLVVEDLHWIDSETQAWLDLLLESLQTARLLLLVNYRPEYQHRWGSKTYCHQLRLDALPTPSAEELLDSLLGTDPALGALRHLLIERTQGNPFFLEETVQALVETGVLAGERGFYRLAASVNNLQVPATVQNILTARIDRLAPEDKRLLQAASVIGKDVPFSLLQRVAEEPEEALRQRLARLQTAEFLYELRLFPDPEYTFKHALTHTVAYAGLLRERRRNLHAAVVAAIEDLHADRLVEQVERLGHHAREGEVWDKAARYLRQAGSKVFLRSVHREAATCFEQALDALRRLPETPNAVAESIDLRFDLRTALTPLGEWARMEAVLDEAEALAEAAGDQRRLGRALNYKMIQFWLACDFGAALQVGLRAVAIGDSQADVATQVVANGNVGATYVARGECREGVRHCEAAIALISEGLAQERFGQAVIQGPYIRHGLAVGLGALGRFPEAFAHLRTAMDIAEEAAHAYTLLFPLFGLGTLNIDQGNFAAAVAPLERGLDLCRTRQAPLLLYPFAWALGAAYHGIGRPAEGVALMEDAARRLAEQSVAWAGWAGGRVAALGGAYLLDGRLADATRIANERLAAARRQAERGVEGQLLLLLGDVAAHSDHFKVDLAEEHYRHALALAEELGLRPLVAHCHLGLGNLYRRTGKREQAREHLTTATTMYREMDMRFWLEKAKADAEKLA